MPKASPMSRPNAINPDQMTPEARLNEIGRILAAGLVRMSNRKSSTVSAGVEENPLHFPRNQSRHVRSKKRDGE